MESKVKVTVRPKGKSYLIKVDKDGNTMFYVNDIDDIEKMLNYMPETIEDMEYLLTEYYEKKG